MFCLDGTSTLVTRMVHGRSTLLLLPLLAIWSSRQWLRRQRVTAYLVLPDSLKADQLATDEVAVFCSSECRGVAERIEVSSGKYVWIAYIHGNDASDVLTVKYYSVQTKHMYQYEFTFPFEKDGHYGNIDNPKVIGLKIRTE